MRGLLEQLSDIRNTVHNVGWFMGDSEESPKGWLLCADYECYSTLSIECLGYDEGCRFIRYARCSKRRKNTRAASATGYCAI